VPVARCWRVSQRYIHGDHTDHSVTHSYYVSLGLNPEFTDTVRRSRYSAPDNLRELGMMQMGKGCKRIAYVRVSSESQNEARQVEALAGQHIDRTFMDKLSGKDTNRPQLTAALKFMREGDCLVVHSFDRLARNMRDLQNLITDLNARKIAVEFIKENLTFTGEDAPMSKLMLSILGGVAEFERSLIRERQREGITIAKQLGIYRGRKRSLTVDQVAEIRRRAAAIDPASLVRTQESRTALAREFGVSRQTLYQALRPGYAG
jgi:DNA invertase Pin-like site-specific DNA recombinase